MQAKRQTPARCGRLALFLFLAAGAYAGDPAARPSNVPDVLAQKNRLIVTQIKGAAKDYSRNCQGCHGYGVSVKEIPTLIDRVGYFTHTRQGRAYLVQVPNVAQAHLDDERLAAVLNWMLYSYSRAQLPGDFQPYTAREVAALRKVRLLSPPKQRRILVQDLVARRVIADAEQLHFDAP